MRTALLPAILSLSLAFTLPARAVPPTSDALTTLLRRTFTEYRSWGRVDDELRWAPWLCRMPLASQARVSAAVPGTPHAQKVFFVYASDRASYVRATDDRGAVPEGEIVVKESFSPLTLSGEGSDGLHRDGGRAEGRFRDGRPDDRHPLLIPTTGGPNEEEREFRALQRDGHSVGPGVFHGLYVLARLDHRWTYGTLDASGTITAAGQIASCIGCHETAPHDHLFGLDAQ